jgi:hypothetical protein
MVWPQVRLLAGPPIFACSASYGTVSRGQSRWLNGRKAELVVRDDKLNPGEATTRTSALDIADRVLDQGGGLSCHRKRALSRQRDQGTLLLSVIQAAPCRFCLLGPGGIEARKITIGFGIFSPAQPLTIFNDRRTTTRLPDGARLHVSVLPLWRLRRSRANDAGAVDAEACRLAGSKRSSGGYGGRLGCGRGSGGLRRICRVGGASMVHRPCIPLRGRILLREGCRIPSGNNEQGTHNSAHFSEPRTNEMEHQLPTPR